MVRDSVLLTGAALALGSSYAVYTHRHSISRALWRGRLHSVLHGTKMRVVVVECEMQWLRVQKELRSCCESLGCIGFDCEWVSTKTARRPIALLQLATHTGLCVLVRLCRLDCLPAGLLDILSDHSVYKAGVGIVEDCKRLYTDRGIVVNGALDIRDFFPPPPVVPKTSKKKLKKAMSNKSSTTSDILKLEKVTPPKENAADCSPAEAGSTADAVDTEPPSTTSDDDGTPSHADDSNGTPQQDVDDLRTPGAATKVLIDCVNDATTRETGAGLVVKTEGKSSDADCNDNSSTLKDSNNVQQPSDPISSSSDIKLTADAKVSSGDPLPCNEAARAARKVSLTVVGGPTKLGLSSLALHYLGRTLDKDWRVRASDWETERFTQRQVAYAAEDARSGLHVLLKVLDSLPLYDTVSSNTTLLLAPLCSWCSLTKAMITAAGTRRATHCPAGGWDAAVSKKYCQVSKPNVNGSTSKGYRRAFSLRKTPLYHNSVLWAPDNEPLCTVDPKKANWYVQNGLGVVVQDNPLIVRLNFEPTGRPQKEGSDGNFYLNERQNICVVCGQGDSYIRKNIIPHEYRKHFPEVLKSHQNHDVVLLCTDCHQLSNQRDSVLRYSLADQHDAPIGNTTDVRLVVDSDLKAVKSAAKALVKNSHKMPAERIAVLKVIVQDFFGSDPLTDEHIKNAAVLDADIVNESYEPHGIRVFKHYEKIGIILFEKLWREHFLSSMAPEFMPTGWSVTHNHEKLKMKMARHPVDDPVRQQYKLALVGSEGSIDIAYIPQTRASRTALPGKALREQCPLLLEEKDYEEKEETEESSN